MSGIPQAEMGANCALVCPAAAGMALGELAAQLTPPEAWLLNPPELRETEGLFTADAVRTVVTRNRLQDPESPTYGVPQLVSVNAATLWIAQKRMLTSGEHLEPLHIESLQVAADRREAERQEYAALPAATRAQYAKNADEHLIHAAATLLNRDPQQAALIEMESLMREYFGDDMFDAVQRGLHAKLDTFDKIYAADQAPFRIALHALERCDGPWLHVKKRLIGGVTVREVCPNGPRDKNYFNAEYAHKHAPRE